jgi:hypothetical protein
MAPAHSLQLKMPERLRGEYGTAQSSRGLCQVGSLETQELDSLDGCALGYREQIVGEVPSDHSSPTTSSP